MYNVPVVEFEVSQTHVRHGRVGYSLHKACATFVHAKSCGCMKVDVYTWNTYSSLIGHSLQLLFRTYKLNM